MLRLYIACLVPFPHLLCPAPFCERHREYLQISWYLLWLLGPGSVVGIATAYGLDGPGIESRCGLDFLWGLPSILYNGCQVFPWGKCGRGVTLTPHPLLVSRSKIEYSYTSNLPKGLRGLWTGETYLLWLLTVLVLCSILRWRFVTIPEPFMQALRIFRSGVSL